MNDDNFAKIVNLIFITMAAAIMVIFYFFLKTLEKEPQQTKPLIIQECKKE